MKKVFVSLLLVSFLFIKSSAQSSFFTIEQQNVLLTSNKSFDPSMIVLMGHSFKGTRIGVYGLGLVSRGFSEMFVGPKYLFTLDESSTLEIGSGIGIENYKKQPIRGMSYVYVESNPLNMNKHKFQCLMDLEYLGSGDWYLAYATCNVSNGFGFGLHAQKNAVMGLRLQAFPVKWMMIYGVAGWNFEANNLGLMASTKLLF